MIAVVYTLNPRWTFRMMAIANIYLSTRPDVKFIATNDDSVFSTGTRLMPDVGALLVAQEVASGRQADKVGKPDPFGFQVMQEEHGDLKNIVMIGDNLHTDIAFGANIGASTCLVLTGVSKESDIDDVKPTYVVDSFSI